MLQCRRAALSTRPHRNDSGTVGRLSCWLDGGITPWRGSGEMASTPTTATPTGLALRSLPALTWQRLLRLAALTEGLLLLMAAWVLGDRGAFAFGVVSLLAFGLLRWRSGQVGAVLHALLFVDVAGWMVPGAVINLVNGAGVPA